MTIAPFSPWKGVPTGLQEAWHKVFASSSRGLFLDGACPVCGARALCRYYQLGVSGPVMSNGVLHQGKGTLWEWCSGCKTCEHSQALVPLWWQASALEVDPPRLGHAPSALDQRLNPLEEFVVSFRAQEVGVLTRHGGLPAEKTIIRLEAFRGPGHFELSIALREGGPQVCSCMVDARIVEFSVESITSTGDLVIGTVRSQALSV